MLFITILKLCLQITTTNETSSNSANKADANKTQRTHTPTPHEKYPATLYNNLYDDIFEVQLPNTLWGLHRCPERTAIVFSEMNMQTLALDKMLTITKCGEIKMYLTSKRNELVEIGLSQEEPIEQISKLIAELNESNE